MRYFEKISFNQFKKDILDDRKIYDNYKLPVRKTEGAAAYDFEALTDFIILPGEIKKIPTGVKVNMEIDEVLLLIVRSSMGYKNNVRLCNQVGVIDSDYYNNSDNEGHIWIRLKNEGEKPYVVKQGDGIIQGIFIKYLKVDEEKNEFKDRTSNY